MTTVKKEKILILIALALLCAIVITLFTAHAARNDQHARFSLKKGQSISCGGIGIKNKKEQKGNQPIPDDHSMPGHQEGKGCSHGEGGLCKTGTRRRPITIRNC